MEEKYQVEEIENDPGYYRITKAAYGKILKIIVRLKYEIKKLELELKKSKPTSRKSTVIYQEQKYKIEVLKDYPHCYKISKELYLRSRRIIDKLKKEKAALESELGKTK